ncbi:hypothetical protein Pelo_8703 [Pelomyxa schiedti]|nr:hypothetical protein Pelo_8703 [Pelomyxa schiedti]
MRYLDAKDTSKSLPTSLENVTLLVTRVTKSGKSMFINSLIEAPLLPAWDSCCTVCMTTISYGAEPCYRIGDPDHQGMIRWQEWKPLSAVPTVTLQGASLLPVFGRDSKGDILDYFLKKQIQVKWPHPLLEAGVQLIDSPGLEEEEKLRKVVEEWVERQRGRLGIIFSPA